MRFPPNSKEKMLSKKIKLFFSRLCFSVAYLSPALGLILMGHLDRDWVACIVVMTVCEWGKKFLIFFMFAVCTANEIPPSQFAIL